MIVRSGRLDLDGLDLPAEAIFAVIRKPFDLERLVDAVKAAVGGGPPESTVPP